MAEGPLALTVGALAAPLSAAADAPVPPAGVSSAEAVDGPAPSAGAVSPLPPVATSADPTAAAAGDAAASPDFPPVPTDPAVTVATLSLEVPPAPREAADSSEPKAAVLGGQGQ